MKKTVMICDDAMFLRAALKKIIEAGDFEVIAEAANGMEAIQMYQKFRPDVVTMDITMPEMDGIAAVEAIMELDPQANIVMCSAMGQQEKVIGAISAGAKDFIVKPFEEERVLEALERVFD